MLITKYRLTVFITQWCCWSRCGRSCSSPRIGRILRAGSRDPEMVGLLGIRLPRVLTAVFGLGCCLAGIAGVLAAPLWTVIPSMSEAPSCRPSWSW